VLSAEILNRMSVPQSAPWTAALALAGGAVAIGAVCSAAASAAPAPTLPTSSPSRAIAAAGNHAAAVQCAGRSWGAREVALADRELRQLVADETTFQKFGSDINAFVQPASIDIPLSGTALLVKEKVLPFQQRVRDLLPDLTIEERSLAGQYASKGATLNCPV
jgi:hypothetical protein